MSSDVKIAIIGAGLGGIGMGIKLRMAGETDFVILEKSNRVGGTWRDNTYPGAACDVQSHIYWYSFDEHPDWSCIYPGQAEILANIERLVDRHDVRRHVRLNTELASAAWDDTDLVWDLRLQNGETITAEVVITAWGQLNRPSTKGIADVESFAGEWFHSARWNHDVKMEGKRVASIGNGPSAAQFIPPLAEQAGHLTVFQRSPNYIVPREDRPYTEEERKTFLANTAVYYASREAYYRDHEAWIHAYD